MIARLRSLPDHPAFVPLLLAGVTVLAYGLLAPWLGFYWDEWPMTWIAHRLGPDGLARYFSTNRPYWGMIYRLTTPLLGAVPWHWQVFGLFWRWVTAVAVWGALRQVWRRHPAPALWASLLFLVYPGFTQQSIGMMYGHFFVVLSAYLLSLWCSLAAVRTWSLSGGTGRLRFLLLTLLALLLSLVNLLAMEYFFVLELFRAALIAAMLREMARETGQTPRRLPLRALLYSLPYLILFVGAAVWRALFFRFQTQNYDIGIMDQLRAGPLATLGRLIGGALNDLFHVTVLAWARPFLPANLSGLGARSTLLWALVTLAALILVGICLRWAARRSSPPARDATQRVASWAVPALILGLLALLLAGPPFWLTQLEIHLDYPNNRFTLPFMLGASLLLTGLIGLLPGRSIYKAGLVTLLVSAAVGYQFQQGVSFQRDWKTHNTLFWQMQWRMPALQPGTTLISSNLPLRYYSDNSLAGPLNWIYGVDAAPGEMPYMYYFASVRSLRRPLFQPGNPIEQDYLAATFHGSTDQMVAITFSPPGCMRVLEPDLDPTNTMLPELMRQSAPLSNADWILPHSGSPNALTPRIFGAEPAHGWCYYYEQADLARQLGDWKEVTRLGDLAFASGDYPNDPMERLPFVEGYAHVGSWDRARELTEESDAITPLMRPILCKLWQRIEADTSAPAAVEMLSSLDCGE
jgi:hypothetical protein